MDITPIQDEERAGIFRDILASMEESAEPGDSIEVEIEVEGETPEDEEEPEVDYAIVPHSENLAEYLEDEDLRSIALEAVEQYTDDLASRADWEKTCKDGMEYLGLELKGPRSTPFLGASSVVDPVITEAIIRFQSNAIQEVFKPGGPVRQKIWGAVTPEAIESSERKQDFMNFILTTRVKDYRIETERLLWDLGYCGSAFRKTYKDPATGKLTPRYLPAEDVIIPYGYPSLWQAPRYSLVHRYFKNELRRLQINGFYRDVEIPAPAMETRGEFKEAKDKAAKETPSTLDGRHQVIEMYCELNLKHFDDEDGLASPYIVTFELESQTILSIRRNWDEMDDEKTALHCVTQYTFIPGPGSYGFGFIHLIGNLAKAGTNMLRMLMDAAACENLPGGLYDRRIRMNEGEISFQPFEFAGVSLMGDGTSLRDAIFPFPFKGPSQQLAGLRTEVRQTVKELAAIADPMNGAVNGEIAVGTLLALIEQKIKVMTAVQARFHASLKQEFSIMERLIREELEQLVAQMPEMEPGSMTDPGAIDEKDYPYDVEGGERKVKLKDFSGKFVSEPVSDPNLATFSQRLLQIQAVMASAAQAPPGTYDIPALHREFVRMLMSSEVANMMVPDKSHVPARDPVSEVQALLNGEPVKAYPFQDHQSHLSFVMSFIQNPKRAADVGQMPQGQQIMAAAMALAADRIGYIERQRVEEELGFSLPPAGEPIPAEVEINLSKAIAEAGRRVFEKDKRDAEMAEKEKNAKDPLVEAQLRELKIKEFKAQSDVKNDADKNALAAKVAADKQQTERMRIETQREVAQGKLQLDLMWLQDEVSKTQPDINEVKARTAKLLDEIGRGDGYRRLQ